MSSTDYDSLSSKDESDISPEEHNKSNPFFQEDFGGLLSSVKKFINESDESSLNLSDYGIGEAEVRSILGLLTNSESKIKNLSLERSNFTDSNEGLFKMLVGTKLESLDIIGSKLKNSDFLCLMEVLKHTQIISLYIGGVDLELDLNEASKFTSHLLASRLTDLDIDGTQFKPGTGALTFIQALPHTSITYLCLGHCYLHNDAIITLFSIIHRTSITNLDASFNEITDAQLEELCGNLRASKLEELDLSGNYIDDPGMDILAAGLVDSHVFQLNVSSNEFSGSNSFCSCLKNTKINELNFSCNRIIHSKMFSFPDFLKGSSVEILHLEECELGDEIGQKLMQSLKFSDLKLLELTSNKFGALTFLEFAKIIKDTKLGSVDLSENPLPFPELGTFAESLKNSQLILIFFRDIFTQPLSLSAIPFFLSSIELSRILLVDVGSNELAMVGTEAIVDILVKTKITSLLICDNEMGSGVVKLANHLEFSSLTALSLAGNKIEDDGAKALANCLKKTQITYLELRDNLITSQGAADLAQALKNSTLLTLDLQENKIGNNGFVALAQGIKDTFITSLNVSNNPGNRILLIEKVLWENRTSLACLIHFFKKKAPQNVTSLFKFEQVENINVDTFVDDLLNFSKTLSEQRAAVYALAEDETIPFSKTEILTLMSKVFPRQFSMFIARREDWNISHHLNLLRKAEKMGLDYIVESLLWNRPIYIIDKDLNILHPYVYKLLVKYNQPLYNLAVEPEGKTKIISYFSEHNEYPDSADIISLLS